MIFKIFRLCWKFKQNDLKKLFLAVNFKSSTPNTDFALGKKLKLYQMVFKENDLLQKVNFYSIIIIIIFPLQFLHFHIF